MLFIGWQGIYTFVSVSLVVVLMIVYFANKLNQELIVNESDLLFH